MDHAQISIEPFSGSKKEDFGQFEQLFQGYIGVAAIDPPQQANYICDTMHYVSTRRYPQRSEPMSQTVSPHYATFSATRFYRKCFVLKLEQLKFRPKERFTRKISGQFNKKSSESVSNARPTRGRTD